MIIPRHLYTVAKHTVCTPVNIIILFHLVVVCMCDPDMDKEDQVVAGPHDKMTLPTECVLHDPLNDKFTSTV